MGYKADDKTDDKVDDETDDEDDEEVDTTDMPELETKKPAAQRREHEGKRLKGI